MHDEPDIGALSASRALDDNRAWHTQDIEGLVTPQILIIRRAGYRECLLLAAWQWVLRVLLHDRMSLGDLSCSLRREHHIQRQFESVVEHTRNQIA